MEVLKRIPAEGTLVEQQVVTEWPTPMPEEPQMKFRFESETTIYAGGWLEVRYYDEPLTGGLRFFYCTSETELRLAGSFGA